MKIGTSGVVSKTIVNSADGSQAKGGDTQSNVTSLPYGVTMETSVTTYITETTIVIVTTYTFRDINNETADVQVVVNRFPHTGMAN